jgi:hypothetical protein
LYSLDAALNADSSVKSSRKWRHSEALSVGVPSGLNLGRLKGLAEIIVHYDPHWMDNLGKRFQLGEVVAWAELPTPFMAWE